VADHAAVRVDDLSPKALGALVHWLVERGVPCKALATEAAAKLVYTLCSPTWAQDAEYRALFAAFLGRVSAAGAASPALLAFARADLAANVHLYSEDDVRSTASLLAAVGLRDPELDRIIAIDHARRQRRRDADPRDQRAIDALYGRQKAAEKNALRA
jgi:hypothetical protein